MKVTYPPPEQSIWKTFTCNTSSISIRSCSQFFSELPRGNYHLLTWKYYIFCKIWGWQKRRLSRITSTTQFRWVSSVAVRPHGIHSDVTRHMATRSPTSNSTIRPIKDFRSLKDVNRRKFSCTLLIPTSNQSTVLLSSCNSDFRWHN